VPFIERLSSPIREKKTRIPIKGKTDFIKTDGIIPTKEGTSIIHEYRKNIL